MFEKKMKAVGDVLYIKIISDFGGEIQISEYSKTKSEKFEELKRNLESYIEAKKDFMICNKKWEKALYYGIGDEPKAEREADSALYGMEMFEGYVFDNIKEIKFFSLNSDEEKLIIEAENIIERHVDDD